MPIRIALGMAVTALALAIAGRRFYWISRLIRSGRPAPERVRNPRIRAEAELVEVGGQRKLLRWTVPGLAHAFTFWGFTILMFTILEAYGDLFSKKFAIWGFGHNPVLGFIEDFFAVAVLVALGVFSVIRIRQAPARRAARVALLRLAHRGGLAGAGDDRRGDGHAAPVPGGADQHR